MNGSGKCKVGKRAGSSAVGWLRSAFVLGLLFCIIIADTASSQQVHDSMGVRILNYGLSDRPPGQWRVSAEPILEIGGHGGSSATEFWNIASTFRLENGTVVVADAGSREIRFFRVDGEYIRSVGGEGTGPGEFPSLWGLWRDRSTLVGVDGRGFGHVFTIDGEYLRTLQPMFSASVTRIRRHGYSADGTLIGSFLESAADPPTGHSIGEMTLVAGRGTQIRPLGMSDHHIITRRVNQRPGFLVYGPEASVAVLSRNYCMGFSRTYSFRCFDLDGRLRTVTIRGTRRAEAVTDAARSMYFAGIDMANPGDRAAAYRAEVRETTEFADSFPAFGAFVVATDTDELWIGPYVPESQVMGILHAPPRTKTTWSIYSAEGRWVADVTLPPRFYLTGAGSDYVIGIGRDDEDVERVQIFRLYRQ